MTSHQEDLVLPGRTTDLALVIDYIEHACARAGVDQAAWFDLQLATEEACANVIEHAYQDTGGQFSVRFETRGPDVCITVHDHGRPFEPQKVRRADLSTPLGERPLGGLGLHLMQKLMDEVQFTFSATDGNTLVMVKRGVVAGRSQDG